MSQRFSAALGEDTLCQEAIMTRHHTLDCPRTVSLLLCLSLSASACAWMGAPVEGPQGGSVQVVVHNHSFSDMNIFLERDGHLHRLGFVMSQQTESLTASRRMVGGATSFRLVADPIGSVERLITPMVEVHRTGSVHWMVEPAGHLSTVVYRN